MARSEFAPRRNAGGDPARPTAIPPRLDDDAAPDRGDLPANVVGGAGRGDSGTRSRTRLSLIRRALEKSNSITAAPVAARHRNAGPLSDSYSGTSGDS